MKTVFTAKVLGDDVKFSSDRVLSRADMAELVAWAAALTEQLRKQTK